MQATLLSVKKTLTEAVKSSAIVEHIGGLSKTTYHHVPHLLTMRKKVISYFRMGVASTTVYLCKQPKLIVLLALDDDPERKGYLKNMAFKTESLNQVEVVSVGLSFFLVWLVQKVLLI
ncbi:unnamed protein product [Microthlaspi erraticum]|uniref:Uncharacterized protein n=1 Tax=Microthlaspi erraticum TaxID=1685480 RepID=A0A6D2IKF7_9BRAS|nr:unnamed protein product [Microthlaspi erraticum]CAA7020948.1 unnamed protein product [Microthlaspi erraticum]CAA7028801.1 unnamed protein product [Microthlaspi erraticum]